MAWLSQSFLFAAREVGAGALRDPFHRFGGDLQPGQQIHLLAASLERRALAADQRQHAAHTGRKLRLFHIQHRVTGELTLVQPEHQ